MPNISWTGNEVGIGSSPSIKYSATLNCSGSTNGSWTSCPSNRFLNTIAYWYRTPTFNIALSSTTLANSTFQYTVNFGTVSAGASWNIDYELWNADTNTKVGNLNAVNSITGTTSASCVTWTYNPFRNPNPDPSYSNLVGNYYIRIVFTTTNTNNNFANCVAVDNVWFYYGVLSQVDAGTGGLTQPTYSTSTSNVTVNGSGSLLADLTFTKSTQSSTNCSGSSGTGNTPLCKLSSVKGVYQINKINKSTEENTIESVESMTIPYQSGVYNFNKTSALFEDSSFVYEHIFTYQDWAADGLNLEWKSIKVTAPAKPARTATISYGFPSSTQGSLSVTLDGAFCSPLDFTSIAAKGYSTKQGTKCIGLIGTASGNLSLSAGSTSTSNNSVTRLSCSVGYRINDPVTVASNGVSAGTTSGASTVFTINGQQLTVLLPFDCTTINDAWCI